MRRGWTVGRLRGDAGSARRRGRRGKRGTGHHNRAKCEKCWRFFGLLIEARGRPHDWQAINLRQMRCVTRRPAARWTCGYAGRPASPKVTRCPTPPFSAAFVRAAGPRWPRRHLVRVPRCGGLMDVAYDWDRLPAAEVAEAISRPSGPRRSDPLELQRRLAVPRAAAVRPATTDHDHRRGADAPAAGRRGRPRTSA